MTPMEEQVQELASAASSLSTKPEPLTLADVLSLADALANVLISVWQELPDYVSDRSDRAEYGGDYNALESHLQRVLSGWERAMRPAPRLALDRWCPLAPWCSLHQMGRPNA